MIKTPGCLSITFAEIPPQLLSKETSPSCSLARRTHLSQWRLKCQTLSFPAPGTFRAQVSNTDPAMWTWRRVYQGLRGNILFLEKEPAKGECFPPVLGTVALAQSQKPRLGLAIRTETRPLCWAKQSREKQNTRMQSSWEHCGAAELTIQKSPCLQISYVT